MRPNNTPVTQRILVAEDDFYSCERISAVLRSHGYGVTATSDGIEAQEEFLNNPPDLAILDIQMPYLTGSELCRTMKANPEVSHIPVMLLSAFADTAERARQCGADDYFLKPYTIPDLYARIAVLLARPPLPVLANRVCLPDVSNPSQSPCQSRGVGRLHDVSVLLANVFVKFAH